MLLQLAQQLKIKKDPHSGATLYGFDGFPSWHGGELGI